jgi:hypothetical protein
VYIYPAATFTGVHFNHLAWGAPPDDAFMTRAVHLYKYRAVVGLDQAFTGVGTSELLGLLARWGQGLEIRV